MTPSGDSASRTTNEQRVREHVQVPFGPVGVREGRGVEMKDGVSLGSGGKAGVSFSEAEEVSVSLK